MNSRQGYQIAPKTRLYKKLLIGFTVAKLLSAQALTSPLLAGRRPVTRSLRSALLHPRALQVGVPSGSIPRDAHDEGSFSVSGGRHQVEGWTVVGSPNFARLCLALTVAGVCSQTSHAQDTALLNFENFPDGTVIAAQYAGVTFTNAIILTAGRSLNEFQYPPHSGANVLTDQTGPITITFALPVTSFKAYFTHTTAVTVTAYDATFAQVAVGTSVFVNNTALSGDSGDTPERTDPGCRGRNHQDHHHRSASWYLIHYGRCPIPDLRGIRPGPATLHKPATHHNYQSIEPGLDNPRPQPFRNTHGHRRTGPVCLGNLWCCTGGRHRD